MLDLVLIGFGNVARRFVTLVDERQAWLSAELGETIRIVGIATRRHGCAYAEDGLDAVAFARDAGGLSAVGQRGQSSVGFLESAIRRSASAAADRRLIVVEATTLDIERGEPAVSHVRTALAGGAHVVAVNKGPAAFAFESLAGAAREAKRLFLFEGAVLDGIPIFNLVRKTLPAVTVTGFRGVVNSTTNYIITAMENGRSFEEALSEMQRAGIAEANASHDTEGWDAAAKTAALANVLLGASVTPHEVDRQPIGPETAPRAVSARWSGRRLKLVARADRGRSRAGASVALEELPEDDVLASLAGGQNGLILQTDLLGEIAIIQRGSGLTMTAYALLSDVISIARANQRSLPTAPAGRTP